MPFCANCDYGFFVFFFFLIQSNLIPPPFDVGKEWALVCIYILTYSMCIVPYFLFKFNLKTFPVCVSLANAFSFYFMYVLYVRIVTNGE